MYKIYRKNNYLIIDNGIDISEKYLAKDVLVQELIEDVSYEIFGILPKLGNNVNQLLHSVSLPNILKEDNLPYTTVEWVDFYTVNTGFFFELTNGGGDSGAIPLNQFVNSYSDLPDPTTTQYQIWVCENSEGIQWLPGSLGGTYYPEGGYVSNGVKWIYHKDNYQASQLEVDEGIISNKWVSPLTLENTSKWLTKYDVTNPSNYQTSTQVASALTPYITTATANATYQPVGSYITTETDPTALKLSNNLSDLPNVVTARTNLGLPSTYFSGAYSELTGIPSTFTPSTHAHVIGDVTNLQTTIDGKVANDLTASTTVAPSKTAVNTGLSLKEEITNKQNSLAVDGTGVKYTTVDAVNNSTVNFNPKTTKIALIGDSITLGVGSASGNTSYADVLNSFFGFQTYTKLGFSSMTVKPTSPRPQLSDKISLIPLDTNYITLMIGINDWAENNVIGDVSAVMTKTYASLDQTLSFAEAFRYNLETIKNNFPDAEIRVITPIKHDGTWVRNLDFKFYVEAEIQIANFLAIPVINAFESSGIYKNSTVKYIPDGIHPNDAGYQVIASVIQKGIIEKNTEHCSNTSFNQKLSGKPEFVSLAGNSESLRITGAGYLSGNDTVGGFSIGNFFNSTGQRGAYFGGSDSTKKLVLNDNIINGYNFTTNTYDSMQLSSSGKKVTIGNTIGPGSLLNIGNFGFSASNTLLGLFGGTGQSGDYIRVENVSGVPSLRLTATTKMLINTNVNNGIDDIQVPNGTISALPATLPNQVVVKSQLDLLNSDIATKQNNITLTTTGTSGVATLVGSILNIPNYATGGGGGSGNSTTQTVDFGSTFNDKAQIVVIGQSWVTTTSNIVSHIKTPTGVDPDEMRLFEFDVIISDLINGVGFTLTVYSEPEATGNYDVMCIGV